MRPSSSCTTDRRKKRRKTTLTWSGLSTIFHPMCRPAVFTMQTFSGHNREVLYVFSFEHADHDYNPLLDYIKLLRENAYQYLDVETFVGYKLFSATLSRNCAKLSQKPVKAWNYHFLSPVACCCINRSLSGFISPRPTVDTVFLKQALANGRSRRH